MRQFLLALSFIPMLGASASLHAQSSPNLLRNSAYTVYTGDYSGDGQQDVLLKLKKKVLIIDVDIAVPILLNAKPGTLLLLSSGGSFTLQANPGSAVEGSSVWQPASYQLIYGDFTGSGVEGMLVKSQTAGGTSFTINTQAGGATLVQTLTPAALGVDLGASGGTTELQDQNNDGRADLVVSRSGLVTAVLLANIDGTFTRSDQASIQAVWFGFLRALSGQDLNLASQYIAAGGRARYLEALQNMGGAVTSVRQTLSNFSAISVTDLSARFVVDQVVNGVTRLHFVEFVFSDGRWMLVSL